MVMKRESERRIKAERGREDGKVQIAEDVVEGIVMALGGREDAAVTEARTIRSKRKVNKKRLKNKKRK